MIGDDRTPQEDREWYAVLMNYGRAMLAAQGFERSLLRLADLQADSAPAQGDEVAEIAWLAKLIGKTAGQLEKMLDVPEPLAARIGRAVKRRNRLAHDYLFALALEDPDSVGREQAVRQLIDWRQRYDRLAADLRELSNSILQADGPVEVPRLAAEDLAEIGRAFQVEDVDW